MDFFRVISPNNLHLSKEECKEYLTSDEDPMLCVAYSNEYDVSLDLSIRWDFTDIKLHHISQGGGSESVTTGQPSSGDGGQSPVNQLKVDDPVIHQWLQDNFQMMEGHSIARADIYLLFCDFCQNSGLAPCNHALFGKTVRNTFPQIKTRRIGIRKHSRYHYTGISPKLSSIAAERLLLIKKNSAISESRGRPTLGGRPDNVVQGKPAFCQDLEGSLLDPKMGPDHLIIALLPNFPTIHTVCVADEVKEETAMLLSLYRFLALDILTAVIKTQFKKLQEIVSVFWSNVPNSIYRCLTQESMMHVIVTCDRQIYGAMIGLLAPNILINMPKSMIDLLMENFGRHFQQMVEKSLQACPYILKCKKMEETRRFCRRLFHRLSLCRLCCQVREFLKSEAKVVQLYNHIRRLNVADIVDVSKFVCDEKRTDSPGKRIQNGIQEFQLLLQHKAGFESYTRWIKAMFKQAISGNSHRKGDNYAGIARVTVLELSYMAALIARELRAGKALPSVQITFHMLEMFFVSYLKHLLDMEFGEEKTEDCSQKNTF